MLKVKYTFIIWMVSILTLSIYSCSNEEILSGTEQSPKGTLVQLVATANVDGDDSGTRTVRQETSAGLGFQWAEGDQLLVTSDSGVKLGVLTLASGAGESSGTFSGEIYVEENGQTINIFYLGSETDVNSVNGKTFEVDLSTQDGSSNTLEKKDVMWGSTTVSLASGQATVSFNLVSQLSFAHYTLDGGSGVDFDGAEVTLSGTNLYSKATFDLSNGTKTLSQGSIKVKAHGSDLYLILGPAENVELAFTATINATEFSGSLPIRSYAANRYFASGEDAGYPISMLNSEWVDLGLTSKTLWASKNIGATLASDAGSYFAWGDVTGTTIQNSAAAFGPSSYSGASKSTESTYGTTYYWQCCATQSAYSSYNIATYQLGSAWTMPTPEQVKELLDETTNEKTTYNGVTGYKFTSKTDSSKWIFIPSAGYRSASSGSVLASGTYMYVWTSEIHWYQERLVGGSYTQTNYVKRGIAFSDYFGSLTYGVLYPQYGFPVRPVKSK